MSNQPACWTPHIFQSLCQLQETNNKGGNVGNNGVHMVLKSVRVILKQSLEDEYYGTEFWHLRERQQSIQ
jgi:hypothetical protein